jgi:hypothetical protein
VSSCLKRAEEGELVKVEASAKEAYTEEQAGEDESREER